MEYTRMLNIKLISLKESKKKGTQKMGQMKTK